MTLGRYYMRGARGPPPSGSHLGTGSACPGLRRCRRCRQCRDRDGRRLGPKVAEHPSQNVTGDTAGLMPGLPKTPANKTTTEINESLEHVEVMNDDPHTVTRPPDLALSNGPTTYTNHTSGPLLCYRARRPLSQSAAQYASRSRHHRETTRRTRLQRSWPGPYSTGPISMLENIRSQARTGSGSIVPQPPPGQ